MRLTPGTDHALRTLMYLAVTTRRLATIADISAAYGMSGNSLTKVVHRLGQAGFIETIRGRRGGIRLARAPGEINLGAVVRRMEPDLEIAPCFAGPSACTITPCCVLRQALTQALAAFLAVLDGYSLADLVRSPRRLAGLLDIPPAEAGGPP